MFCSQNARLSLLLPYVIALLMQSCASTNIYQGTAINSEAVSVESSGNKLERGDYYFERKKYAEAMKWYQKAAENGNAAALNKIGQLYKDGLGVSQNYSKAMNWFLRATQQWDGDALFNVGAMHEKGLGVPKNNRTALSFYVEAARKNNHQAAYRAGWLLENGIGVEKNIKFAVGWYRQAADVGNIDALLALGSISLKGLNGGTNYVAARIWYRRAADRGNAEAQNALGLIYQNGLGVKADIKEAIKWYELSAKNGYKDAQANLDLINKNKLNTPEAFLKAARDGDPGAMYNLAVLFDNGVGTSVDHIKAIEWFIKAAQTKSNSQEVRELVLREKLLRENYKELESIAEDLRRNKIKNSAGYWKLERFYYILSSPMDKNSDEHWQYLSEKIEKWNKTYPKSVTARIAKGQFYTEYAWNARGTRYANTVSDENWRLFNDRLKEAAEIMNEAQRLPEKSPQWYAVMLRIAFGQGWDAEAFNGLFNKAITFEPSYLSYYDTKSYYLAPMWYGNEGANVRFADEMEQRLGGKEGLSLYSHIFWNACTASRNAHKFMKKNLKFWDKIKRGFIYREELYGENYFDLSRFCYMAVFAGDKQTSRELFNRIGNNWDKNVFVTENTFKTLKSRAFE